MNKDVRDLALGVWAIIGVPLFFWAFVYFAYPAAEAIWYGAFGLCLVSGAVVFVLMPFPHRWLRIGAVVLYLAAMPGLLVVMGLFAVCANGDCL